MKFHLILTYFLTLMVKENGCYIILPNGDANQQSAEDSSEASDYKYGNIKPVFSQNDKESVNIRKDKATNNDSYDGGAISDEVTVKLNIKNFQNEELNKSKSMAEIDIQIQMKDIDVFQDKAEIDEEDIKDIVDVMTNICGEPYQRCKRDFRLKFFKKSSICPMCSCNVITCHISKNCCPDVLVDNSQDIQTSKETCMKLFDVISFKDQHKQTIIDSEIDDPPKQQDNYSIISYTEDENHKDLNVEENEPENKSALVKRTTTASTNTTASAAATVVAATANTLSSSFFPKYLVTDTCQKDFPESNIIDKCEGIKSNDLIDNVPVSDWQTMRIYRNKWCALCHNVTDVDNWRLVTDCLQIYGMNHLPFETSTFYDLTKNCTVRVVARTGMKTDHKICGTSNLEQETNMVDKCNTTGQWNLLATNVTATVVQKLCEKRNYLPIFTDLMVTHKEVYKNIFCYICNSDTDMQPMQDNNKVENEDFEYGRTQLYKSIQFAQPSVALGVWSEVGSVHNQSCPYGTIPDVYTDECIQFECPIYQTAISNLCVDRQSDVTGLTIASMVNVQFQDPVYVGKSDEELIDFGQKVAAAIDKALKISETGCEVKAVKLLANFTQASEGYVHKVLLAYKIANTKTCTVKQVVEFYSKIHFDNFTVPFENIDSSISPHNSSMLSRNHTTFNVKLSFFTIQNYEIDIQLHQLPVSYEVWLTQNFQCPRVKLSQSLYRKLVHKGLLEPIQNHSLHTHNEMSNELIPVCYLEYLDQWLNYTYYKSTKRVKHTNYNTITSTLTMISTTLSMVSVIVVLITYTMFSELRFISGKLFMVLCFNLLLAQCFYSFGFDLGVDNIWCQIIGVCIHMFWLTTVFLMSSCLWLLLKNFNDPLCAENRYLIQSRSNCHVLKYTFYCYIMSGLCVVTNIIISHSVYHDDHYGYGGSKLCYINSGAMRMVTFALPIALVLIINFIMFIYIMSKMSKLIILKHDMAVKELIIVFLKLSTMTGFYWAFGFLYEATELRVFEYIFILLNCGQGFFLMWSFLFNKRILELYKNIFKRFQERFVRKLNPLLEQRRSTDMMN